MEEILSLLKRLTQAVGVSGCEDNIADELCSILEPYGKVSKDSLNNVYCTFGDGYHFLLDAHLDEIGLIVTEITNDGFIKFDKCGGIDFRMLSGYQVSVWGKKEIKGVISAKPPHLQTDEELKSVSKLKDLSVDTGYTADELRKIVRPGDRITFKRNFTKLLNNRVSASCLDDRAGVCAVLLCLEKLKKLPCKITVMFSSQEELGLRGAGAGAFGIQCDEAICVDVSFALAPGCDPKDCGVLGGGAMIGFSPILNAQMSKSLKDTADELGINYQIEVMNGKTGTNADVLSITQSGIKTALISIPERYMHQPVEVVDLSDIENTAHLIGGYIAKRVGEYSA